MFSRFFVRRPVFAWVIAILIMLAGVLAIRTLPVGQYPDVAPPAVKISATYTGASAETLENSVTQVIEQQLTGLDHLLYFSSTSSSDGWITTPTFTQRVAPFLVIPKSTTATSSATPTAYSGTATFISCCG